MARRKSLKVLRDADDLMHLLTGKRFKDVVPRAIEIFGDDIVNRLMREVPVKLPPDDPYSILEVRKDASDFVVKAVHRAKVKICHPDNRETGNAEEFKRIQEAYEKIMKDRNGANKT